MVFNLVGNEKLLVTKLFPAVPMYSLEVRSKVSGAAAAPGWESAATDELNATPEGGQIPVASQEVK